MGRRPQFGGLLFVYAAWPVMNATSWLCLRHWCAKSISCVLVDCCSPRATNSLFTCEGQNMNVKLNFNGFQAGSNQIVQGGEIALFDNKTEGASGRSAIQYIILRAQGEPSHSGVKCPK